MIRLRSPSYWSLMAILTLFPAIAVGSQPNNLAHFILAAESSQTSALVTGNTGGFYSLASINNKDRYGNPCMGYGDPQPDHIMTLESDFSELTLQVNSGGNDTTLIIKGPGDNNIRCGFGKNNRRDAIISDRNWLSGTYQIWVGSVSPNQRTTYRLSVEP